MDLKTRVGNGCGTIALVRGSVSALKEWRDGDMYISSTVDNKTRYFSVPKTFTSEDLHWIMDNNPNPEDAVEWLKSATQDDLERVHLMSRMK